MKILIILYNSSTNHQKSDITESQDEQWYEYTDHIPDDSIDNRPGKDA